MQAMILAAGRGERMRPLTDTCPKPLLQIAGKPLLEHHIIRLAQAGINHIVINYAWQGQQIVDFCGDGSRWGVQIQLSDESQACLETAGGIIKALPLLASSTADAPFLVVNGDIFCGFDFLSLPVLAEPDLAHLYLVPNPEHNADGDFRLVNGRALPLTTAKAENSNSYTFSGIGIYRPSFFVNTQPSTVLPLGPLLKQYATQQKLSACLLSDYWFDVGTPERLQQLNQLF
jgi:N-acetyl-alpha-D-muramate 1-phosphate uridylyltransferase